MAFPNSPPTRHSMRMHPLCSWRQWFSPPFPLTGAGMRARRHSVDQPHVEVRLARLSAGQPRQRKNFTARRCFNPRKWHFRTRHPPATARRCTLSPCSSPWRFSLPPALTAWEWKGGIQSISPTSRCGPPSCAPPACGPPSCACPSYVALSCSASLAEVVDHIVFSMATKPHDAQLRRTL